MVEFKKSMKSCKIFRIKRILSQNAYLLLKIGFFTLVNFRLIKKLKMRNDELNCVTKSSLGHFLS